MNYLPKLRSSLVDAAREQYGDAALPRKRSGRRRRLTTSGIATALASAIAVAVALVAVASLGHRRTNSRAAASRAVTRVDLRRAAADALNQLTLPAGAVASGLVRGTPSDLWSAPDQLRIPGHVDVYRIWRLPENPQRVISFIAAHRPTGSMLGFGETSGSSSSGGGTTIYQSATTLGFPGTTNGIWREIALNAASINGGGTALRVDSEAGWLKPRPADERIPLGVSRITLTYVVSNPRRHGSVAITSPARVRAVVALFNSLPAAPPGGRGCQRAPTVWVQFAFEGPSRASPLAIAAWRPACQTLLLSVGGHQEPPLMASSPTMPPGAQIALLLTPYATRRVSSSPTNVNSSQGCASTKSKTSGLSPSAPGAAGALCTSASRSTRSGSSP